MSDRLTLLYTHRLQGDLARLPRLYTRLRERRAHAVSENSRVLVFDLGEHCAPDVWHCAITDGRSMLVALDGMGYDAANILPLNEGNARERLGDFVQLQLVDETHAFARDGVCAFVGNHSNARNEDYSLAIRLEAGDTTTLNDSLLTLMALESGIIGEVALRRDDDDWHIEAFTTHTSHDALPDPTIAGVVDFIIGEARYAEKRRAERDNP